MPGEAASINGGTRKLGFGGFSDWTYAASLMYKEWYVKFLLGETDNRCPEKKKPTERRRYKDAGVETGVVTGALE